jgi:hypothetical protein
MAQRQQLLRAVTSRNKDIAFRLKRLSGDRDCRLFRYLDISASWHRSRGSLEE